MAVMVGRSLISTAKAGNLCDAESLLDLDRLPDELVSDFHDLTSTSSDRLMNGSLRAFAFNLRPCMLSFIRYCFAVGHARLGMRGYAYRGCAHRLLSYMT